MADTDSNPETWKAVPGYEGLYEVSDLGRVRSLDRIKRNGRRARGKILATPLSEGYPCCNLCLDGKQILHRVHRLVTITFIGPAPDDADTVNHKDFDRTNNRLENLEWLSHGENLRHAHAADRCRSRRIYKRGEAWRSERLSADQVLSIRSLRASGHSVISLAAMFHVSRTEVIRIVNRTVWKSV